jgi:protein SCO1/2
MKNSHFKSMLIFLSFPGREHLRRRIFLTVVASVLGVCPACGHQDGGAPASPASTSPPAANANPAEKKPGRTTKDYRLVGVVKGLDKDSEQVRIRHEEIPGFMGAMTMPFTIKDPQVFTTFKTGDRVEGTLRVEEEDGLVTDYQLSDLKVTAPGDESNQTPEQELVVSLAGGSPSLRVKPKTLQVGEIVPDFTMTDQNGKTFKLSDLRGEVVALTFVYTRCPLPDFCPLMDRKFSELARRIGLSPKRSGRVRLISLSFDPEHDTPEVLSKHAAIRGANPPLWTYAVASHVELAKIAPRLGLIYGPGQDEIMHNLCTAVIDGQGKLARLEVGTSRNKWEPTDILKTIDSLISSSNN